MLFYIIIRSHFSYFAQLVFFYQIVAVLFIGFIDFSFQGIKSVDNGFFFNLAAGFPWGKRPEFPMREIPIGTTK